MAEEINYLTLLRDLLEKVPPDPRLAPKYTVAPPNTCNICHHFAPGLFTSTKTSDFVVSATSSCPGCSLVLQVLEAVTDIRRPAFTTIELERTDESESWKARGVLKIRCVQEGRPHPDSLFNEYDDPFPNRYTIYTPADAGEEAAIPWLGLRGGGDGYKEMTENLDDRLAEARAWLQECFNDHRACDQRTVEWPRRVLDTADETIRLITSASLSQTETEQAGYACLSYAWGTSGNLKTLKENLEAHQRGIDVVSLPRTLSEAVYVCKSMRIRYLWIDALCIIQDDTQDWKTQIHKMASIYQGAELVISAQSATNVHQGFLSLGPSKNAPFKRVDLPFQMPDSTTRTVKLSIREEEHRGYTNIPAHHSCRPVSDSDVLAPLTTRAWVFQESFLARRILYTTPSELAWQCTTCHRCECQPAQHHGIISQLVEHGEYHAMSTLYQLLHTQTLRKEDQPPLSRMHLWGEIIEIFSSKKLSFWTDRIAAMQGVVEALIQAIPDTFKREDYLFGLWEPFLVRCLAWARQPDYSGGDAEAVTSLRSIAPSWSWMTVIGVVHYYGTLFDPKALELATITYIERQDSTSDAPDSVYGAGACSLLIQGFLIPVRYSPLTDTTAHMFILPERFAAESQGTGNPLVEALLSAASDDESAMIDMIPDDPTDSTVFSRVTHFAPLIRNGDEYGPKMQGMFLEKVGEELGGWQEVFRRVGHGYDFADKVDLLYGDDEDYEREMTFYKVV